VLLAGAGVDVPGEAASASVPPRRRDRAQRT